MSFCGANEQRRDYEDSQAFHEGFLLVGLMKVYSSNGSGMLEKDILRFLRGGIEIVERRLGLKNSVGKRLYSVELERELMKAEENKPYFRVNEFLTNSIGTYSRWRKLPDIPENVGNTLRTMFNERLAEVTRIARGE